MELAAAKMIGAGLAAIALAGVGGFVVSLGIIGGFWPCFVYLSTDAFFLFGFFTLEAISFAFCNFDFVGFIGIMAACSAAFFILYASSFFFSFFLLVVNFFSDAYLKHHSNKYTIKLQKHKFVSSFIRKYVSRTYNA